MGYFSHEIMKKLQHCAKLSYSNLYMPYDAVFAVYFSELPFIVNCYFLNTVTWT